MAGEGLTELENNVTVKLDAAVPVSTSPLLKNIKAAEALWATSPAECVGRLRLLLNGAKGPDRLAALQSYVVYAEWEARIAAGLAPYHSVDASDVGFRFHAEAHSEYLAMKASLLPSEPAIMKAYSLEDPGEDMGEWAKVHRLREPPDGPLAWIACDGKYFNAFGAVLLKSLEGTAVHLHLMDASEDALRLIDSTGVECGLSVEKPRADKHYYHAVRFVRFAEDMERFGRQAWLLDVDAIANGIPSALGNGLSARFRPGRLEPWNQINAAVVGADPASLPYLRRVGAFINRNRSSLHWGIDQLALWCVYQQMNPEIRCLGPKEVDYDYQNDGIIWCNSGSGKFRQLAGDETDRPKYQTRFKALAAETGAKGEARKGKAALVRRDFKSAEKHFTAAFDLVAAVSPVTPLSDPPDNPRNRIGKFLYLPVEVSVRELPSRAWLAGECAKRGFNVVLGAAWNMADYKWRDWPPGIVLFKTMNALDATQYHKAKAMAGHQVAVLSEELYSLAPEEWLYRVEIEEQALVLADLICAQGEKSAGILKTLTDSKKVVVTGNPRAVAKVSRETPAGGKILVCLMSGTVNGFAPFDEYMEMVLRVLGKTPEGDILRLMREQIAHECKWLPVLLETIEELRKRYGDRVQVRPHPVEDKTTFGFEADNRSFDDALKESACVVYVSGCGTGVEAKIAGVPCVRVGHDGHGLSRSFGIACETPEHVVDAVAAALKYGPSTEDLGEHFAPVTLPDALESLWRRNKYPMEFDLAHAYREQRKIEYVPGEFEKNKFAKVADEDVAAMVGLPVERVGWNLWIIRSQKQPSTSLAA